MKVTAIQQNIVWASPSDNLIRLGALIGSLPDTDLIVLPEMFSTGFVTEPEGVAEKEGLSLEWMKKTASQRNCAVAGSVAVSRQGAFYNRFYFVKPDSEVAFYDKHHLFSYSGEDKLFTAGDSRVIVEFRGIRFLLLVCYDLRFPVWSRCRGDYDAIIYTASWPVPRIGVWRTLLRARAIENQSYVVGVNRMGRDPYCDYVGGTAIIDPYGGTLAECADDAEEAVTADLDAASVRAFREKFPAFRDADGFTIKSR